MNLKFSAPLVALIAAFHMLLDGCSVSPPLPDTNQAVPLQPQVETVVPRVESITSTTSKVPLEKPGKANMNRPPPHVKPDAVIKFQTGSLELSAEMQLRLDRIAAIVRNKERASIRLEGYVPGGGSSAWNIGEAEKSLSVVKLHLEKLHIPASRIQMASFGEEHRQVKQRNRQWIEVYILQPKQ